MAYLLDKHLNKSGSTFEQYLADFYQAYGIPQIPLSSKEVIEYIDTQLDDTSFTGNYVLGTESIPFSALGLEWKYYWPTIQHTFKKFRRTIPVPYRILIVCTMLLVVAYIIWRTITAVRRSAGTQKS